MQTETSSDAQRATAARDEVQRLNVNALLALQARYGITLPRNAADWRPTLRVRGHIPGFEREFEVLCTDGIVAWYKDAMDVLFYGHTQHFTGDIKPLHSVSAQRAAGTQEKAPRVRKSAPKLTVAHALDVLRGIAPKT